MFVIFLYFHQTISTVFHIVIDFIKRRAVPRTYFHQSLIFSRTFRFVLYLSMARDNHGRRGIDAEWRDDKSRQIRVSRSASGSCIQTHPLYIYIRYLFGIGITWRYWRWRTQTRLATFVSARSGYQTRKVCFQSSLYLPWSI